MDPRTRAAPPAGAGGARTREGGPDRAFPRASECAPARWLGLAAAPTFAAMAVGTALAGAHADWMCTAMRGPSALFGMTAMYALMALFHLPPWLRMLRMPGARRRGVG